MKKILELKNNTKGQSLVEFALILPVLILIILGIIEFGWLLNGQITLTNAAREGARTSVVCDSVTAYSKALAAVQKYEGVGGLTNITIKPGDFSYSGGIATVKVTAENKTLTGFFNGTILPSNGIVNIKAIAQMKIE
ncbi:MAG: pilus assembly protein [Bacillota bacterium]|nr:pilus assembly protein [Bacillota bacterium]